MPLSAKERRKEFDRMVEEVLASLPLAFAEKLEDTPLAVEDEPSSAILKDLGINRKESDLCGLHWGIPLPMRSVMDSGALPNQILIFRGPIQRLAGRSKKELKEQIRITILHELGHLMGLDEEALDRLGYG